MPASSFRRSVLPVVETQRRMLPLADPLSLNLRFYVHYCPWDSVACLPYGFT